jgi:hypothetical protein
MPWPWQKTPPAATTTWVDHWPAAREVIDRHALTGDELYDLRAVLTSRALWPGALSYASMLERERRRNAAEVAQIREG